MVGRSPLTRKFRKRAHQKAVTVCYCFALAIVSAAMVAPARADGDDGSIRVDPAAQPARAGTTSFPHPLLLNLQSGGPSPSEPPPESIYAPPEPPAEGQGVNEGAVHTELTVRYMTDYIFRGLDRSDGQGLTPVTFGVPPPDTSESFGAEDAPTLLVDGRISFDLGKLPHPYVGVFTAVFNSDPVSRFQEVRPSFGAVWTIRPLILDAGQETFIYPEREDLNTGEVYLRITLDDSYFFRTERPLFSPYVFTAYDYDLYNGFYFEAGVTHDFIIEDLGLTIRAVADAAYVMGIQEFSANGTDDEGWQHYDIGVIARYSINDMFHLSTRYGEWSLEGYLFYTDGINNELLSTTQMWGGAGISFRY
jgi:hypothetical protein